MIEIPLEADDRAGVLRWQSGSAPVLEQGTLRDFEADRVLEAMRASVDVAQLDGEAPDSGTLEAVTVIDRASFLYLVGTLPGVAGVLPDWSAAVDLEA